MLVDRCIALLDVCAANEDAVGNDDSACVININKIIIVVLELTIGDVHLTQFMTLIN